MLSSRVKNTIVNQNNNDEDIQQYLLPNDELIDDGNGKQTESHNNTSTNGVLMEINPEIKEFILQAYREQFDK